VGLYINTGAAGQPGSYILNWTEQSAPLGGQFQMTSPEYDFSLNDGGTSIIDSRGGPDELAVPARATLTRLVVQRHGGCSI